jgi:hypothetical protein
MMLCGKLVKNTFSMMPAVPIVGRLPWMSIHESVAPILRSRVSEILSDSRIAL